MTLGEPTSAASNEPDRPVTSGGRALPAGARLNEFEVEGLIGEGSIAVVYAAIDHERADAVAIAEYLPAGLAQRDDEANIVPRTSAQADAFAKGLKAFIRESHALARCNHPSLVRVVDLLELNSTAYRVMPRYGGRRLLEERLRMDEPPDEEALLALVDALLGALAAYHHAGGCHGRVTPSNILLPAQNHPLLLGPGGAARAIAGDRIDALQAAADPSFAPIEQIVEPDKSLHPSVDLYALAGVARYWMSGELPEPAFGPATSARPEKLADTVRRLRRTWPQLHYSASLLEALDNALSIYPAQRPQSVEQMRELLPAISPSAHRPESAASTAAPARDEAVPSSTPPTLEAPPPAGVAQDVDAVLASAADADAEPRLSSGVDGIDDGPPVRLTFARPVPHHRRAAMWAGAVLVLLALPIGILEYGPERLVGRVRDVFGVSGGTDAGAPLSKSAVRPAAPVTPSVVTDAPAAKSTVRESTANESPAKDVASASPSRPNDAPSATASIATPPADVEPRAATPPADARARTALAPPTRAAQQRPSRAPTSPREVCGARTHFSLYRCMQTQCSRPQWSSHAQCERLRTTDRVE